MSFQYLRQFQLFFVSVRSISSECNEKDTPASQPVETLFVITQKCGINGRPESNKRSSLLPALPEVQVIAHNFALKSILCRCHPADIGVSSHFNLFIRQLIRVEFGRETGFRNHPSDAKMPPPALKARSQFQKTQSVKRL